MSTQREAAPSAPPLADLVRDAYVAADPGPSAVEEAAAQAVYGYLFAALKGDGDDGGSAAAAEAAAGVVAGVKKHNASYLWLAARGAVVGVVHAAVGHRRDERAAVRAATARLMTEADGLGGDYGAAAQGAVEGALTAAEELGLDEEGLGSVAAAAALETARGLAPGALQKVDHLVTRRVMGYALQVPSDLRPHRGGH